jgi:4-amino-4-deoxy-L-arabinose transferase-like glycosyltransferase
VPFRVQLAAILLLFLALHGLYNLAIPLGEGPDEPGHLKYALFLAAEGRLPVQRADAAASDVPGEGHQPPLAYALAAPAVAWLSADQRQILLTANPRFVWAGGDEPGAFMRGSHELAPWPPLTAAWHLARAVSGLAGAAAVAFTFLAARRLRPADPLLPALAAALVALNPQLLFTTALVTNDALLAALGAAILWWCVRGPAGRGAIPWALAAGALFGLALLTKQSALLLGPVLLFAGWRAAGRRWGPAAVVTIAWGGTALLVAGWWFLRNRTLYGDLFGLGMFTSEYATQPFAWGDAGAWAGALRQLFGSFWGRFGWMSLPAPAWSMWAYGAVCLAALAGLALAARRGLGLALAGPWALPALAALMALAWTLAFAATAGLVAWQGRMLFPAAAAIALILAAGLLAAARALAPRRPVALVAPLAAGLVALAALMPAGVIRPGYAWVALAPREAQAALGTPTFARYAASWEDGVALRGWRLDAAPAPGAPLPVTLTWNSLEPVPRPWTVFVHLVDGAGAIVAESNSQPRGGALPFPLWTPGDWVADTHALPLPADLPPGRYELRVGLYRPEKGGQRQKVWAEDGSRIGDLAVLGTVTVGP